MCLLPRKAKNDQKRAIKLLGRPAIDTTNNAANLFAADSSRFVGHHLGGKTQSVFWTGFKQRSQWEVVLKYPSL